jgi:hypothetical protein
VKERGGIRKSNINGVNWTKVHYMLVVNITMKSLCTYAKKKILKKKEEKPQTYLRHKSNSL